MRSPGSPAGGGNAWRALAPGMRRVLRFLGPPEERWEILIVLALVVGVLSGMAAVGLRSAVHWLFHALVEWRIGWSGVLGMVQVAFRLIEPIA